MAVASAAICIRVVDRPDPPREQQPEASVQEVGPEYFETLGISLRKGRVIDERDRESTQWVAVVNETLARNIFPDDDPLGKLLHLRFGGGGVGRDDEQPRLMQPALRGQAAGPADVSGGFTGDAGRGATVLLCAGPTGDQCGSATVFRTE